MSDNKSEKEMTDEQKVRMVYFRTMLNARKITVEFVNGYLALSGAAFTLVFSNLGSFEKVTNLEFAKTSVALTGITVLIGLLAKLVHHYASLIDTEEYESEEVLDLRKTVPKEIRQKVGFKIRKEVSDQAWTLEALIPALVIGDLRNLKIWEYPEKAFQVSRRATRLLIIGLIVWTFWISSGVYWALNSSSSIPTQAVSCN